MSGYFKMSRLYIGDVLEVVIDKYQNKGYLIYLAKYNTEKNIGNLKILAVELAIWITPVAKSITTVTFLPTL